MCPRYHDNSPQVLRWCLLFSVWFWCTGSQGLELTATATPRCGVLDDASSMRHFDVMIPTLTVPSDVMTTYICQVVKIPVPVDRDYHAVAFQPLIDNRDVMHHMIIFSCEGHDDVPEQFSLYAKLYNLKGDNFLCRVQPNLTGGQMIQPHSCGRADNRCRSWMAQWSAGVQGTMCPHSDTGVRFGVSVGSYLMVQLHWNNALFKDNLTDHSGMRVYYTDELRPFDLGHVQVGQQNVVIPPGITRHAQAGGCSGECTRMLLPHPIHVTTALLHMHYLGSGGWLEVIHSDGNISQVFHDDSYDFNHPDVHHLMPPFTVMPGDYLRLTCLFSSKDGTQRRNKTVYFGEGAEGEMCYVFLAYYPMVRDFDQCLQLANHDLNCPSKSHSEFQECTGRFVSLLTSQFVPDTVAACNRTDDFDLCHDGCKQALDFIHSHNCLQGGLGDYVARHVLSRVDGWQAVIDARTRFSRVCGALAVM